VSIRAKVVKKKKELERKPSGKKGSKDGCISRAGHDRRCGILK